MWLFAYCATLGVSSCKIIAINKAKNNQKNEKWKNDRTRRRSTRKRNHSPAPLERCQCIEFRGKCCWDSGACYGARARNFSRDVVSIILLRRTKRTKPWNKTFLRKVLLWGGACRHLPQYGWQSVHHGLLARTAAGIGCQNAVISSFAGKNLKERCSKQIVGKFRWINGTCASRYCQKLNFGS